MDDVDIALGREGFDAAIYFTKKIDRRIIELFEVSCREGRRIKVAGIPFTIAEFRPLSSPLGIKDCVALLRTSK